MTLRKVCSNFTSLLMSHCAFAFELRSSAACLHSSAHDPTNEEIKCQGVSRVVKDSKWLQCGTGRDVFLWCSSSAPSWYYTHSTTFPIIGTSRAVDLLRFPLAHRWQYTARSSANLSQMQQQGQSAHGQVQSSSQTQLAAVSTPVILPLLILAVTTAPVAASAQPQLVPLRIRFVLFLCCASPHMQVNIAACGQSFNLG